MATRYQRSETEDEVALTGDLAEFRTALREEIEERVPQESVEVDFDSRHEP